MSQLSEAIAAAGQHSGTVCTIAAVCCRLPNDEAAELGTFLADPDVTGTAIARALSSMGHRVGAGVVQRHRRGDCVCDQ